MFSGLRSTIEKRKLNFVERNYSSSRLRTKLLSDFLFFIIISIVFKETATASKFILKHSILLRRIFLIFFFLLFRQDPLSISHIAKFYMYLYMYEEEIIIFSTRNEIIFPLD